jgi:AcrR family transcriptional regulator
MSGAEPSPIVRTRIGRDEVFAAAEELVDDVGWDALTMSALAVRLGVKAPSLYHHVDGLEALRSELQVRGWADLSGVLLRASVGRTGVGGMRDQAHAQRNFALAQPHRYDGMTRAAIEADRMAEAAATSADVSMDMVMSAGVPEGAALELVRALFAAHHGFISLEISGFFAGDVDIEGLFELVLDNSVLSIEAAAKAGGAP